MQRASAQEHPPNLEMSLREHLLAAGAPGTAPPPYPPSSAPPPHDGHYPQSDGGSPHDQHLDPNVTGGPLPYAMSGESAGDDPMSPDNRKGKRELSTSKRAAQNRAAQRAFRQRKEGYIKKLEEQVKEFETMEQNYKALQAENYQLREYILSLQSRLLESQSDFPPPPSHINLAPGAGPATANLSDGSSYAADQQIRREIQQQQQPQHPPPPAQVTAREDPMRHDGISQLQAAAAHGDNKQPPSAYGIGNEYPNKRTRSEENGGPKV